MILYFKDQDSFMEPEQVPGLVYQGKLNPNKKAELIDPRNGECFGSVTLREFM